MMRSSMQCPRCGGTGTVVRARRRLADGKPDPHDFRASELCPTCGGAGGVPHLPEPRPATADDYGDMGCCL